MTGFLKAFLRPSVRGNDLFISFHSFLIKIKYNKDPPYPRVFLFLLHQARRIFRFWLPIEYFFFSNSQSRPTIREGKRIRVSGRME